MSRKQKLKARDKVTRKMSRDGLVERNSVTGEDIRVSKREADADLKRGKRSSDTFLQLDKRGNVPCESVDTNSNKKKQKQRRITEQSARAENTASTGVQPQTVPSDTPKQADIPIVPQSETSEREEVRHEQPINRNDTKHAGDGRLLDPCRVPQKAPPVKSKPPPVIGETPIVTEQTTPPAPHTEKTADALRSPLKHEDNGKLQFERDDKPAPTGQRRKKPPQKYKTESAEQSDGKVNSDSLPIPDSALVTPPSALKHDAPDRLRFEPQGTEDKPQGKKTHEQPKGRTGAKQAAESAASNNTPPSPVVSPTHGNQKTNTAETTSKPPKPQHANESAATSDTVKHSEDSADSPLHSETTDTPLHADKADTPLKPDKPGKLQFSEDEKPPAPPTRAEAKQQRKYGKAQKQTDKAVKKLDTAKSKLPSKKKLRSERVFNEETGKAKRKLYFESEVKSQGEHLKGALPLRPVKAAGNSALAFGHRKMYQVERENVATEAAHKIETSAEGGVRMALRHHKTAPYRKVAKLEHKVQEKSIKTAYQKALAENPKLKSNPLARAFQKRKIKKDYAKAAREAQKAAQRAKKAGTVTGKAAKALAGVIKRHPVAAAAIVLILLLLFCLMSLIGAFGSAGSGGLGGILSASYLAEDEDIDNAELYYTEWEVDLQEQIANTESTHAGYDEYRYNIGEISHNPYELMSYLTVRYQNFTYGAVESDLRALFGEQYSLTFTPTTETRYADPTDADEDGDYEPYEWHVMTVTLAARSFGDIAVSHLSGEQLAHYALLMQTNGSRQYLANPFGDMNWLPYVTSYYGYRIHPISGVKDLHRGVDIGLPTGTEIHSGQKGTVTFAGYNGDYGNVVIIEDEKGLVSKYAHCDSLLVSAGQTVNMGDVIATVGNTGNSTGSHLHLEVLKNGQYLNPLYFCDNGSFNLTPSYGYAGTPMGDGTYAALIAEAEKYLGFPYVWGGSSPATSFDCSGFVSWVLTQSGVKNTGRLGAQGLYNICTPVSSSEARPGDLIFFTGTYSAPLPVTHVGIYVGTDASGRPRMLHCGSPIQYTYIDTAYWQQHFYAYGRISSD